MWFKKSFHLNNWRFCLRSITQELALLVLEKYTSIFSQVFILFKQLQSRLQSSRFQLQSQSREFINKIHLKFNFRFFSRSLFKIQDLFWRLQSSKKTKKTDSEFMKTRDIHFQIVSSRKISTWMTFWSIIQKWERSAYVVTF